MSQTMSASLSGRRPALGSWNGPLMVTTWFHVALLAVAIIGLLVDHRTITGVPAWLKPFKFAVSTIAYAGTLAWVLRDQPRTRILRLTTTIIAVVLIVENVIIFIQAYRGTTSHFNIADPADQALFSTMGVGIGTLWVASLLLFFEYRRHPIADRPLGRAIELGFFLTVIGSALGGVMLRPTPEQLAGVKHGDLHAGFGAHTVGAPDGGPGLPLTGWSRAHGDLRIAHFVGLHAIQLLPLLVLGVRWRGGRNDTRDRRLVTVAGALYALLMAALLVQALAGHPLIAAGATTT